MESDEEMKSDEQLASSPPQHDAARIAKRARKNAQRRRSRAAATAKQVRQHDRAPPAVSPPNESRPSSVRTLAAALAVVVMGLAVAAKAATRLRPGTTALFAWFAAATASASRPTLDSTRAYVAVRS
eukprot:6921549-Prymnesium_polylepis.1